MGKILNELKKIYVEFLFRKAEKKYAKIYAQEFGQTSLQAKADMHNFLCAHFGL